MNIDPEYSAIGRFFADNPVYTIPIYQRGYAWEKQEIDDFLKDLENVFNARKVGKPKNHFFGSIVTVQHKLSGVVGKYRHELVDGQQRATTFVLGVIQKIIPPSDIGIVPNLRKIFNLPKIMSKIVGILFFE